VEALLRGVSDGQDILTMSLGGADGWTESTTSVLSSRISANGKIVTIAAGNDVSLAAISGRSAAHLLRIAPSQGSSGSWYTSGPGNGINAISVASLDK
jgi:hypothetical protein